MPLPTKATERLLPIYVPWRSFTNYIASLKNTTVPHTLDGSARPRSMSGGLWRQVIVGLRFLGLTARNNEVAHGLEQLVVAHGTDQWPTAVKEHVLSAYERIVGDLPIENATSAQLHRRFQETAEVKEQMLKKCVRFYLHALKESGVNYSKLLLMRDDASPRKRTRGAKPRQEQHVVDANNVANNNVMPQGMVDFPIPLGEVSGLIRVPVGITIDQFPMVEAMLRAVETLAKQNSPPKEKPTR